GLSSIVTKGLNRKISINSSAIPKLLNRESGFPATKRQQRSAASAGLETLSNCGIPSANFILAPTGSSIYEPRIAHIVAIPAGRVLYSHKMINGDKIRTIVANQFCMSLADTKIHRWTEV